MITGETIENAVNAKLEGTPHFLTEVELTADGKIYVFIDSFEKFSIEDCIAINKGIRKDFGEALDDYDLTVSSAGMDRPFKHMQQYHKNLDRKISILTFEGQKVEGILKRITEDGIELEETPKAPKKGMPAKKKGPFPVHDFNFSQIKEAKRVITFND